jgi:adenylate cyclase
LAGLSLSEVLPPSIETTHGGDLIEHVHRVSLSGQQLVGMEISPILPNRGPVTLSVHLSPLQDASQNTQGVAIVVEDLTEKKRLEAQRRLFERMVSPAVIDQLDPNQLQLGGKRVEITTLFADIRGFTSFSEKSDPELLVSILNQYLAAAAEAVLNQGGTIDKFLGDAVMAWYNAPIPQPDHALRAVHTALGIRDAVQDLQTKLPPQYSLSFGVGIHTGEVVLGLIGTERRLEYTAIGDAVNTAKRIQENAAAGQILISAPAFALLGGRVNARLVEPIHAKGKSQPLEVYEVIGIN